jgi:alpha-ketoglutarate-dependent taurine dioxygenase
MHQDSEAVEDARVIERVRARGWTYIEQFGDEEDLLRLAVGFGEIIDPGVGMSPGMHDGRIYRVAVRRGGEGVQDVHGNTIISTTGRTFGFHTDGYNRTSPPRFVFLLRTDAGPGGPESFVAHVDDAAPHLPRESIATLASARFPSAHGPIALMVQGVFDRPSIQMNPTEIAQWEGREGNPLLGEAEHLAISQLLQHLEHAAARFTIEPGGCLVLDNWRTCHGRSAMEPDNLRALARVWVG